MQNTKIQCKTVHVILQNSCYRTDLKNAIGNKINVNFCQTAFLVKSQQVTLFVPLFKELNVSLPYFNK